MSAALWNTLANIDVVKTKILQYKQRFFDSSSSPVWPGTTASDILLDLNHDSAGSGIHIPVVYQLLEDLSNMFYERCLYSICWITSSSSLISSLLSSTPYRQITMTPARVRIQTRHLQHIMNTLDFRPESINSGVWLLHYTVVDGWEDKREGRHYSFITWGPRTASGGLCSEWRWRIQTMHCWERGAASRSSPRTLHSSSCTSQSPAPTPRSQDQTLWTVVKIIKNNSRSPDPDADTEVG